jgi:hypothetical protein
LRFNDDDGGTPWRIGRCQEFPFSLATDVPIVTGVTAIVRATICFAALRHNR